MTYDEELIDNLDDGVIERLRILRCPKSLTSTLGGVVISVGKPRPPTQMVRLMPNAWYDPLLASHLVSFLVTSGGFLPLRVRVDAPPRWK